jgi:S1-C subfamily serine protease
MLLALSLATACGGKIQYTWVRLNREEAIINIFEQNTYSVVNIFDVTLTVSNRPWVPVHVLHAAHLATAGTTCAATTNGAVIQLLNLRIELLDAEGVFKTLKPIQMQPGATLSADRPEGNGTGIVWDEAGHIVTNYHVLGGALRNYRPGQGQQAPKVARVTLLGGRVCLQHLLVAIEK